VVAGRARLAAVVDPLAAHPYVAALAAGGFAPPGADGVDRAELRQLIQRKLIVERDGIYFHPDVIDQATAVAAQLLAADPEGFTLAALRDATGATRKYIVPLANELDARGITRRRGDLRIAGPRLSGS
jgi:selenocysteine-specific elongation factor